MKADTFQLARDIVQGKWLVSNPEQLLPIARAFLSKTPVEMEVKAASVTTVSTPVLCRKRPSVWPSSLFTER